MILIITDIVEETADAVARALNHRGAEWIRLNSQDIPREFELELDPCDIENSTLAFRRLDRRISLGEITAVWRWKLGTFELPDSLPPAEHAFVEACWQDTLTSLERALSGQALFVNPPDQVRIAEDKPTQLALATSLGFDTPPTLITNSPAAARKFCEQHQEVIFKVANLSPLVQRTGDDEDLGLIYTNLLKPSDIAALDSLTMTPGVFQPRIKKRCDLRVTVVDNQVFTAEIHSQGRADTAVDFRKVWRRTGENLPHFVHSLPDDIAQKCIQLTHQLGLVYGAIDLILTPEGKYVFLEINPNGMFGWVQQLTRMPISIAMADLLIRGRSELKTQATPKSDQCTS